MSIINKNDLFIIEIYHYLFMRISDVYHTLNDGLVKLLDLQLTAEYLYVLKEYTCDPDDKEKAIMSDDFAYYYIKFVDNTFKIHKSRGKVKVDNCSQFNKKLDLLNTICKLDKKELVGRYVELYNKSRKKEKLLYIFRHIIFKSYFIKKIYFH